MNISYQALDLLKYVVTYSGGYEMNPEGREVPSFRRLNGEDSSQRRFYVKEADRVMKLVQPMLDAEVKSFNDLVEKKRSALAETMPEAPIQTLNAILEQDQELKDASVIANDKVLALKAEKNEVTLSEKTVEFLKKHFVAYGTDAGFKVGDDETVEEINSVFGL